MLRKGIILTGVTVAVGVLWTFYYTEWIWFRNLNYPEVFWRTLGAQLIAGMFYGTLAALVIGINLSVTLQTIRGMRPVGGSPLQGTFLEKILFDSRAGSRLIVVFLALILATVGAGQWISLAQFIYGSPFGTTDPVFGKDIGFFVFSLPLYQFTVGFLITTVVLSVIVAGLLYIASGVIQIRKSLWLSPESIGHLSGLAGFFLLLSAWNYRLKLYDLLYARKAVFEGAGYADVNVQRWIYWLLVLVFLFTGLWLLKNIRERRSRSLAVGIGIYLVGAIGLGTIPSSLAQAFVVAPSELEVETQYIKHNIEATRRAYALNRIAEHPFEASAKLTRKDIEANSLTLKNVRIWDQPPMAQAYQQLQEIRPYYVFAGVDVDRYTIHGEYRQVMLGSRELDTDRLPAQAKNWVNQKLQYTHGYGVAMSPVTEVTPEGLPLLLLKDIPPITGAAELEIVRPEIYYGEATHNNVFTHTGTDEFDYPRQDSNVYSRYQGDGGVPIGGLLERLAFAMRTMDISLLLSTYIQPASRILFRRQIVQRAQQIAPFLKFDSDPYLVVSEGRLFWLLDAYTTTSMYPYSTRTRGLLNYIRNSVKVVVDAYNGSVTLYLAEEEPIVAVYTKMFPGLLKPFDAMPEDLRAHVRYPLDLFRIQAAMYRSYHMQDIQVFYNQEDLWEIPNEIYSEKTQMMEPYYIIVKLPGETREEFLLMLPFTPSGKDNMIGWLAARCDGENYGDLLVYKLPKDKLIFGPMQLEARINQQPDIASQLTLWGQMGAEVIRGNLLAIPIETSFLYVEPIYLRARQAEDPTQQQFGNEGRSLRRTQNMPLGHRMGQSTAIPELKQVIVAYGGSVLMRDTFEQGLNELFGDGSGREKAFANRSAPAAPVAPPSHRISVMAMEAAQQYQHAREAMQRGEWTTVSKAFDALEQTLEKLNETLGE